MSGTAHPNPPENPELSDGPAPVASRIGWAQQTREAVRNLTASQREVIQLSYFDRLSHEEIASRIRVPVANVKSIAACALQRIAAAIEGDSRIEAR